MDMLGFPNVNINQLYEIIPELKSLDPMVQAKIEIEGAYSVYLRRQGAEVTAFMRDETMELPADMNYSAYVHIMSSLSSRPILASLSLTLIFIFIFVHVCTHSIPNLSNENRSKLERQRPATLVCEPQKPRWILYNTQAMILITHECHRVPPSALRE